MSLLTRVTVTCINTEQLDRLAQPERLTARDICAALMPQPLGLRKPTSLTMSPDYLVQSIAQLEQQAAAAGEGVRAVLRKVVDAARANGVSDIVFPCSPTRFSPVGHPVVEVPAFVRAALTVAPLTATSPAPESVLLDDDALHEAIVDAKVWMAPHVPGMEVTLAKAARSLGLGPLPDALRGSELPHRALQLYTAGIALVTALQSRQRIGGGDPGQHAVLSFALLRALVERLYAKIDDVNAATLSKVLHRLVFGDGSPKYAAQSNFFHALEQAVPNSASTFRCPPDEINEAAIAACVQITMENDRYVREREALGLGPR